MAEKQTEVSVTQLLFMVLISIGLLLASNVGVFDLALSVSEHLQSQYRTGINNTFNDISEQFDVVSDLSKLKGQRDEYQSKVQDLREEIAKLQEELNQNQIAKDQISTNFNNEFTYVPARVVRYDVVRPGIMIVNKGADDGIRNGDVVVYKNYAVAEVTETNKYTSLVRTIYSPESKISLVNSAGTRGVLVARNGNELEVDKIVADHKVDKGDVFYTLGINSNYPNGLFIGEVTAIESTASNPTKKAKLKNELNFENLSEVYIMHKNAE